MKCLSLESWSGVVRKQRMRIIAKRLELGRRECEVKVYPYLNRAQSDSCDIGWGSVSKELLLSWMNGKFDRAKIQMHRIGFFRRPLRYLLVLDSRVLNRNPPSSSRCLFHSSIASLNVKNYFGSYLAHAPLPRYGPTQLISSSYWSFIASVLLGLSVASPLYASNRLVNKFTRHRWKYFSFESNSCSS